VDYSGGAAFFGLATFALGLYYLIGAYKLFDPQDNSPLIVPILAGLSLATSLITIPFNIYLSNWEWLQILPSVNIIFTAFLIGVIGVRLIKKNQTENTHKSILWRTSILLVITCFFAFRFTGSSIYRNVIIYLNAGNEDLQSNMKSIDLSEKTDEFLAVGQCDRAIEIALESFEEGKKWLWIKSDTLTPRDINELWKIQTTYTNVYEAYHCKAEQLDDQKKYDEALKYHIKADSFLNINPYERYESWKKERADSKNDIGICYSKLNQNDSAAAYYIKAINYYNDSVGQKDNRLATYFYNLGYVYGKDRFFEESNQMLQGSIGILKRDTMDQENKQDISLAYLRLAYNGLASNQLDLANESLKNSYQYLTPGQFCQYNLYSGIYSTHQYAFKSALEYANKAVLCYSNELGKNNQNVAESHSILYDAWMQIPNYDSALAHLKKGIEITGLNYASTTARYHYYVKREGYYYYSVGDYENALKKLIEVKKIYEREFGRDCDKLPEVLATIGQIKIELGEFGDAGKLATESLRLAEFHEFFIDDRATGLLNDIAYINYATSQNFVADTLYKKSIELSIKADQDSSLSVASALNGLGLLATRKSQFFEADSLFNQSFQLYQHRTSDLHPDKGIVLMNQSELFLKRRNFSDALELIDQALENFTPFHRDNHPTIADMYSSKAIILAMKDERTEAIELLTKALEIYESNFQPEHRKMRETRNRLGKIDSRR
jgi:tetratricopeptide (TPR) repeat protein